MAAVDHSPYDRLEFSVEEESEPGLRNVETLKVAADEVRDKPDHPLHRMSELGFDTVEISGEIVDGEAEMLVTAEAPLRWPNRAFVWPDDRQGDSPAVLELSAQSDGERVLDVVVHSTGGISPENNLDTALVTEEAWLWLESVRDGVAAALQRERSEAG